MTKQADQTNHFPKSKRLLNKPAFSHVFDHGSKFVRRGFVIYVCLSAKENQQSRFGFVVSKKVDKRAVVRNSIKRHLRESVRQMRFNRIIDCVVIARKDFLPDGSFSRDLAFFLRKLSG